jgi:hypothetical protein
VVLVRDSSLCRVGTFILFDSAAVVTAVVTDLAAVRAVDAKVEGKDDDDDWVNTRSDTVDIKSYFQTISIASF